MWCFIWKLVLILLASMEDMILIWLAEQLEQLFSTVNFKLYLWDLVSSSGKNKKRYECPLGKIFLLWQAKKSIIHKMALFRLWKCLFFTNNCEKPDMRVQKVFYFCIIAVKTRSLHSWIVLERFFKIIDQPKYTNARQHNCGKWECIQSYKTDMTKLNDSGTRNQLNTSRNSLWLNLLLLRILENLKFSIQMAVFPCIFFELLWHA